MGFCWDTSNSVLCREKQAKAVRRVVVSYETLGHVDWQTVRGVSYETLGHVDWQTVRGVSYETLGHVDWQTVRGVSYET